MWGHDPAAAATIERKVAKVRADQRKMVTAIESCFVDNNTQPAWATDLAHLLRPPGLADAIAAEVQGPIPSFRAPGLPVWVASLTTSVAYICSLPADPFVEQPNLTSGCYAPPNDWILWSAAPDGVLDLDWPQYVPSKPQSRPELPARDT